MKIENACMSEYSQQNRGDADAYARYLANMDAAMRQKVALVAAHLPATGQIGDMGMGSGSGSEALAALYPSLRVIGVDVNPTMVDWASQHYRRANLDFLVGDIARECFPSASLDGLVNSSVLHHVTSYNGYRYEEAARALQAQADQLADYGTLIVRDFLAPPAGLVQLSLAPHWHDCWQRFRREFRGLLPADQRGFACTELGQDERGWWRYEVEHRHAVEFVLRKDYQQDWDSEILEEYCYFTQAEFEAQFRRLGLRVLVSTPLHNPWIQKRRFFEQFTLRRDQELDWPATNFLIVGEKVPPGQGVSFRVAEETDPAGFLDRVCYRQRRTGEIFDLVRRPHPTVDVVPYILESNRLSVVVRHSYPRPILARLPTGLDGLSSCPFTVEPIAALQTELPLGETVEELLRSRAGIEPESILQLEAGDIHYPSPGGIREQVQACFVRIQDGQAPDLENPLPWTHQGQLRALDGHQLLRSAQVHGLSDHRLEMHIFALMRRLGLDPGPWLGDQLSEAAGPAPDSAEDYHPEPRRLFTVVNPEQSPGYLRIQRHRYEELDGADQVLASGYLESVVPQSRSLLTLVALPMIYADGRWWVGLALDDLPAAQAFSGSSQHWIAPAWRLPFEAQGLHLSRKWVGERFQEEFSLPLSDWAPLGGPYFPSPGLTPELVYPYAVRVEYRAETTLKFLPLDVAMQRWNGYTNGHLRCALLRAYLAHRPQA